MPRLLFAVIALLLFPAFHPPTRVQSAESSADSIPRLNNTAIRLSAKHNHPAAFQLLQRASAARPVDTVVYNKALVLGKMQRFAEADQLLQSVSGFHFAEANRGIYRCMQGDVPSGLTMLENSSAGKAQAGQLIYNRALAYYQLDRLPEAQRAIEEALRQRGTEPVYRLLKGDIFLKQGKHREALAVFRSLQGDPSMSRFLPIRIGNVMLGLKQYEEAAELFENYLLARDRVYHFSACYGLGNARYGLKQYARAVQAFRHAVLLEPQSSAAHLGLGHAFTSQRDYKNARESYETVLRLQPENKSAHLGMGVVAYRQGKYEESMEEFELAGDLFNPKDPTLADCFLNRGLARLAMGRNQPAMKDFFQVIQLDKRNAAAHAGVSEVYRKNDNFLQAIRYMDQAVHLAPNNDHLLTNKGNLYLKTGNMDEAYPMFVWALKYNPRNINALNGLGAVLVERDRIERAQAIYDSLITHGHHKSFLYNNRGIVRSYLALKLERAKDFNNSRQYYYRSLKDFERAASLDSSRKQYYNNRGNVYKNIKDFGNAIQSYQGHLDRTAINNMGVLYASNADGKASHYYLNLAIDLDSTNQIYHYNRYRLFKDYFNDSLNTREDRRQAGSLVLTNSISAKYSKDGYINIYLYDYDFDKLEFPGEHVFPIKPELPPPPAYRPLDELVQMDIRAEKANSRVSPSLHITSKKMPKPRRARIASETACPKIS
ncbi:tetratricopeptide repeat protein [Tellurirhabdus rosea]|uniref:tetratricopeptide repeat protein n=1 Tax=Tellurirhabdus rosea TaxID=2674997 RepID=UPI002252B873|nr:tetratricopeptide repeat protein [Tellurirhabdus rosea]